MMATPSNGTQTTTKAASDAGDTFAIVDVAPWYLAEFVDAWAKRLHAGNAYSVCGHAAIVADVVTLQDLDQAIGERLGEPGALEEVLELREERSGVVNHALALMFALEHEADPSGLSRSAEASGRSPSGRSLWRQC